MHVNGNIRKLVVVALALIGLAATVGISVLRGLRVDPGTELSMLASMAVGALAGYLAQREGGARPPAAPPEKHIILPGQ